MLVQYSINKAVSNVKVTDEEVRKFFDDNPAQFAGQPTVAASHILVDSEELAAEIMNKINAGEISFEDAAKEYSSCPSKEQGGSLGEFGRGQMVPEFDQACFEMEEGELRGPVKTQFGYHLIRLDAKNDGESLSFDMVSEQIRDHLMAERQQKAYQSRINQLKILYPVER
ncbi:MAG: peptidylprolyl isomerase [Clostridia bacterium]|nr:peptidylprolyl isomerase [Clostridia bacterium]